MLGLPGYDAIDMWSRGCIMAYLYLEMHLPPWLCEYHHMRSIVNFHGQPDDVMLNEGRHSGKFFKQQADFSWRLKTEELLHNLWKAYLSESHSKDPPKTGRLQWVGGHAGFFKPPQTYSSSKSWKQNQSQWSFRASHYYTETCWTKWHIQRQTGKKHCWFKWCTVPAAALGFNEDAATGPSDTSEDRVWKALLLIKMYHQSPVRLIKPLLMEPAWNHLKVRKLFSRKSIYDSVFQG